MCNYIFFKYLRLNQRLCLHRFFVALFTLHITSDAPAKAKKPCKGMNNFPKYQTFSKKLAFTCVQDDAHAKRDKRVARSRSE